MLKSIKTSKILLFCLVILVFTSLSLSFYSITFMSRKIDALYNYFNIEEFGPVNNFVDTLNSIESEQLIPLTTEDLDKIREPDINNEIDVIRYITELSELTRDATDYHPDMLVPYYMKIEEKNLHLLLELYTGKMYLPSPILDVLKIYTDEQHKEPIIQALEYTPQFISLVVYHDWVEDSREAILNTIDIFLSEQFSHRINEELISAIRTLNDPLVNKKFERMILFNPSDYLIETIISLEYIDKDSLITKLWNFHRVGTWHTNQIAGLALSYGNKNALKYALDNIGKTLNSMEYNDFEMKKYLLISCKHEVEDDLQLIEWYKDNFDNLKFDNEVRKWYL